MSILDQIRQTRPLHERCQCNIYGRWGQLAKVIHPMSQVVDLSRSDIQDDFSPSAVVELAVLRQYTYGDVALEREILDLFCSGMPVYFDRLHNDCSGRETCSKDEWHLAIHTIKCSATTIGAWSVADLAVALLALPLDHRTAAHCRLVEQLNDALCAVYRQIPVLIENL